MDRLIFIERIQAYSPLRPACKSALAEALARRMAPERMTLPAALGRDRQLLMVASGIARVYVETDDGRDVTRYFVRAEDFVMANFDGERAAVERVEAVTDLTYVTLGYARFETLLGHYPELSIFYAQALRERGLRNRDRVARRCRGDEFATYESFLNAYPGLELEVPTAHIASYLGMTPNEYMRVRQRYRERAVM